MRALLLVFLLLPVCLFAQYMPDYMPDWHDFEAQCSDSRAMSMGHCEILGNTGSNSIFTNPAHIATFTNRQFQGGGRLFFGSEEDGWYEDYDGRDRETTIPIQMKLTHLSFATPFEMKDNDLKLAFGIGYNTYYDFGVNYEDEITGDDNYKRKLEIDQSGGLNVLTPSVAINLNDKIYAGITLNKSIMGSITAEEDYSRSSDLIEPVSYTDEYEAKISASFITLGALAKMNEQLTLGFIYRTGFDLSFEDLKLDHSEDNNDWSEDGDDFDITIAPVVGFSASYLMSSNLLLMGEYQTRSFKDYELDGEDLDKDNGNVIRLGFEYQGNFPMRAGYFSESIYLFDEDEDKPNKKTGFSGGVGYKSGNYMVDFGLEYGKWAREYKTSPPPPNTNGEKTYEDPGHYFAFFATFSMYLNK